MPVVALIVGHNNTKQGAVRVTDGRSEFDWNSEFALDLSDELEQLGFDAPVIHRKSMRGEIADAYRRAEVEGADVILELHFNSFADPSATGTEVLFPAGKGKPMLLAQILQAAMTETLGLANRGVKGRGEGSRGGLSLHASEKPTVLLEPYFGSNANDCAVVDAASRQLAAALAHACDRYFGLQQGGPVPRPSTVIPLAQPRENVFLRLLRALRGG